MELEVVGDMAAKVGLDAMVIFVFKVGFLMEIRKCHVNLVVEVEMIALVVQLLVEV